MNATDDAVVFEMQINAPPERVFAALTDEKQIAAWWGYDQIEWMKWEFDARLGGRWRVQERTKLPMPQHEGRQDFEAYGEVIEFDPPRTLAYTWFANWTDEPSIKTIVRYELIPQAGGTLVKLTHSGLAKQPRARADYSQGWVGVLKQLNDYFGR